MHLRWAHALFSEHNSSFPVLFWTLLRKCCSFALSPLYSLSKPFASLRFVTSMPAYNPLGDWHTNLFLKNEWIALGARLSWVRREECRGLALSVAIVWKWVKGKERGKHYIVFLQTTNTFLGTEFSVAVVETQLKRWASLQEEGGLCHSQEPLPTCVEQGQLDTQSPADWTLICLHNFHIYCSSRRFLNFHQVELWVVTLTQT